MTGGHAWPRLGLGPGDEILVTGLDHDANVAPWMLAASDRGVTIRQAGIDTESRFADSVSFAIPRRSAVGPQPVGNLAGRASRRRPSAGRIGSAA